MINRIIIYLQIILLSVIKKMTNIYFLNLCIHFWRTWALFSCFLYAYSSKIHLKNHLFWTFSSLPFLGDSVYICVSVQWKSGGESRKCYLLWEWGLACFMLSANTYFLAVRVQSPPGGGGVTLANGPHYDCDTAEPHISDASKTAELFQLEAHLTLL